MTPALMKVNWFNLVNEFHHVTSTMNAAGVSIDGLHSHHRQARIKPWLCVAMRNIVVWETVAHHIQIPLSGHGSGRLGFLVQGEKDRAASAAAQGSRALEQTDEAPSYHVAALLSRSQQRIQVYSFNNIQVHYKIYKIQKIMTPSVSRGAELNVFLVIQRLNASNTGLDS